MSDAGAVCRLCAQPARLRFVHHGYAIHRCEFCDLEFVHPMPDAAAIAAVYDAGYFGGGDALGYRDYFGSERAVADEKARTRVSMLAPLAPAGRWLDVGCADGRFVLEARRRGLDAFGLEHAESARRQAAQEPLLRDRIDATTDAALAHGPFACVTAWDVLEHLDDPFATLRQARATLAPGALVGVVVPVIDNVNARRWPHTWDQYKPPEHLWYFSRRSLEHTLRECVGGEVIVSRSAWRRAARWSDVATKARVPRLLRRVEAAAWRSARSLGIAGEHALDDSWLVVIRTPHR